VVCIIEHWKIDTVFTDSTVTSDVYLNMPSDECALLLIGYGIPINSTWSQQGGAKPHRSGAILCFLHDVF
jgi:hypothetical protein